MWIALRVTLRAGGPAINDLVRSAMPYEPQIGDSLNVLIELWTKNFSDWDSRHDACVCVDEITEVVQHSCLDRVKCGVSYGVASDVKAVNIVALGGEDMRRTTLDVHSIQPPLAPRVLTEEVDGPGIRRPTRAGNDRAIGRNGISDRDRRNRRQGSRAQPRGRT